MDAGRTRTCQQSVCRDLCGVVYLTRRIGVCALCAYSVYTQNSRVAVGVDGTVWCWMCVCSQAERARLTAPELTVRIRLQFTSVRFVRLIRSVAVRRPLSAAALAAITATVY